MSAEFHDFGISQNGEIVHRIVLRSSLLDVSVLTWGAVLQDVRLKSVDHPLTLGSPELRAYEGRMGSFGALMGPVVNRIRDASAPIDGKILGTEPPWPKQEIRFSDGTIAQEGEKTLDP